MTLGTNRRHFKAFLESFENFLIFSLENILSTNAYGLKIGFWSGSGDVEQISRLRGREKSRGRSFLRQGWPLGMKGLGNYPK